MKTRWRAQVGWLLVRSRPFRGLLALTGVATVLVMATSTSIAALQWSPQQVVMSALGGAEAAVAPYNEEVFAPGAVLGEPSWVASVDQGVDVVTVWGSLVSLSIADEPPTDVTYAELPTPSPVLAGKVDLVAGRWPVAAGECVSTERPAGRAGPPVGRWPLTITGQVKEVFSPQSDGVYCAPGTWQTWRLSAAEEETINTSVSAQYYFVGSPMPVASELSRLIGQKDFGPDKYSFGLDTRQALLDLDQGSFNKFMGDRAPLLLLPFAVALVLASRLGVWSGRVVRALVRAGVPAKPMRRTMRVTALVGLAVVGLAGGLVGSVAALGVRPLLSAANGGKPLSNWQVPVLDVVGVLVVTLAGAALGLMTGDAVASARLGQQDRTPRPLTRLVRVVAGVVGLLLVVAALGLMLASDGRLWWMGGGALLMVVAFAAFTPLAIGRLGSALAGRPVSAVTLAGRIMLEGSRRWSIVALLMTLVLGLVTSLFVISGSAIAAQVAYMDSSVPPGSVLVEVQNPDGEKIAAETLERFESDLGLTGSPLVLTELGVGPTVGSRGLLQSVGTVEEAERLLGDLSDEAVATLEQGGALVIGGRPGEETRLPIESTTVQSGTAEIPALSIRPDKDHSYTTGAGIVLASASPDLVKEADVIRIWDVFQGLTPGQDVEARAWTTQTGMNGFQIQAYRPPTGFFMPVWLAVALIGFGLLFTPVLALSLRSEVRSLGGLTATLVSVGVGKRWIRPVFRTLSGTVMVVAVVAAVAPALISIALLSALNEGTFDLLGTPWWMLIGFLLALFAATQIATQSAFRRLGHRDHLVTV